MNKMKKFALGAVMLAFCGTTHAETQYKSKSYSSGFSSKKDTSSKPSEPKPTKKSADYGTSRNYGSGLYGGSYTSRPQQQTSELPRNAKAAIPTGESSRYKPTSTNLTAQSSRYYGQTQVTQIKQAPAQSRQAKQQEFNPFAASVDPQPNKTIEEKRPKGFAGGFSSSKAAATDSPRAMSNSALTRDVDRSTASANALRTLDARKAAAAAAAAATVAGATGYVASQQSEGEKVRTDQRRTETVTKDAGSKNDSWANTSQQTKEQRHTSATTRSEVDGASDWLSGYSAGQAASRHSSERVIVANPPRPHTTPAVLANSSRAATPSASAKSGGMSGAAVLVTIVLLMALCATVFFFIRRSQVKPKEAKRPNYSIT